MKKAVLTAHSDYERYDLASKNYDSYRIPAGLKTLIGTLSTSGIPINEMHIISMGCGTGNYEIELALRTKKVCGVDISPEMISKAKEKSRRILNIEFFIDDAVNMKMFTSEAFDAALFILSLHHFGDYKKQSQALEESYRLLNKGGLIIIQTLSQRQIRDGFWFYDLIPEAANRLATKYIPIPDLINILKKIGFEYKERIPIDAVLQGKSYLNYNGIFRKEWRDGNSIWSLATENELKNAQLKIIEMKKNGTINEYIKKREELREDTGQITYVYSVKK